MKVKDYVWWDTLELRKYKIEIENRNKWKIEINKNVEINNKIKNIKKILKKR